MAQKGHEGKECGGRGIMVPMKWEEQEKRDGLRSS